MQRARKSARVFGEIQEMKKILLPLIALALSSPAVAQSIVVVTAPHADSDLLPVAYSELKAGENQAAVEKLTGETTPAARDPSRLINLVIGSTSCRARECQTVNISVGAGYLQKTAT